MQPKVLILFRLAAGSSKSPLTLGRRWCTPWANQLSVVGVKIQTRTFTFIHTCSNPQASNSEAATLTTGSHWDLRISNIYTIGDKNG